MNNLGNEPKMILIDYSDFEQFKKYTSEKYKNKFNWVEYLNNYRDIKTTNLNDTWNHWKKYGFKEKRNFYILNDSNKNIQSNNIKNNIKIKKNIINDVLNKIKTKKYTNNENKNIINEKTYTKNINLDKDSNKSKIKNTNIKSLNDDTLNHNTLNEKTSLNKKKYKNIRLNISYNTKIDESLINVKLIRKNNLIYKSVYDGYGLQYYGWKKVFSNFTQAIPENDNNLNIFKQQIFIDEWLEKLLIWGDINEKNFFLNEIEKNNYKIISFIHNPPFIKWNNKSYSENICKNIIYNEEYTNKYLFNIINNDIVNDRFIFLYTLSNTHKEYVYKKSSSFKNKLMSILHPIEITGEEKIFDYTLFTQNKQFIHIGWWLRNFKSFFDFQQPKDFYKTILIKKDFENEWNNISKNFILDNITILKQLNNNDYEKLFVNSCVFLDVEDSVANNVILECMKFNTPIIVRKIPSIIEYLGEDYPLYFDSNDDLLLLQNPNYLLNKVYEANQYLLKMDKSHIHIDNFNKKILYDIRKLEYSQNEYLTWFCLINNLDDIDNKIYNLYNNFISQNNKKYIKLNIIISDKLAYQNKYDEFIIKIQKYCELVNNISYKVLTIENYSNFLNIIFQIVETQYLMVVNIFDEYDTEYSLVCTNYMNTNPTCDITFTSYTVSNGIYDEKFLCEKDLMMFNTNFDKNNVPESGIVFRKELYDINGIFNNYNDIRFIFREYFKRAIKNHFNIICCDSRFLNKTRFF